MDVWDEIDGFVSPGEFRRFMAWLEEGIADGVVNEVPIQTRYSGIENLEERWFQTPQGEYWRVVAPEFPFTGVFERVPTKEIKLDSREFS